MHHAVVCTTDSLEKDKIKESKHILDKALSTTIQIDDISNIIEEDLLRSAGVSETDYLHTIDYNQNKLSIIYKRKPSAIDTGPYNTVTLKLLQANVNI